VRSRGSSSASCLHERHERTDCAAARRPVVTRGSKTRETFPCTSDALSRTGHARWGVPLSREPRATIPMMQASFTRDSRSHHAVSVHAPRDSRAYLCVGAGFRHESCTSKRYSCISLPSSVHPRGSFVHPSHGMGASITLIPARVSLAAARASDMRAPLCPHRRIHEAHSCTHPMGWVREQGRCVHE
jgi:hypothetical protein